MNAKSIANTALAASVLTDALRYTPRQAWRFPVLSALWSIHIAAVLLVAVRSRKMPAPGLLGKLGGLVALGGGALALYSAVGEHTREGRGRSGGAENYPPLSAVLALEEEAVASFDQPPSDGTYSASRHPALLGYAVFLAGLTLMTRSFRLLGSAPLWLAAAVGGAALQEELLRRAYPWYEGYIHRTPMLVPTAESAQAAIGDLQERFGGLPISADADEEPDTQS